MSEERKTKQYGTSRHVVVPRHLYLTRRYSALLRGEETSLIDATPTREHAEKLIGYGMTPTMIAAAAGCSHDTVQKILDRLYETVRRETAARIMSVTPTPHPEQGRCLAIGARRRVEALQAIGWTHQHIADHAGLRCRPLSNAIGRTRMYYTHWAAVERVYNALSGTPGPSHQTRARAKRLGYVPPLAWEDRNIDHPDAQPDWAAAGIKKADRPVCASNHRYTAETTFYDNRGHRQCRKCQRAAEARKTAKRRAA